MYYYLFVVLDDSTLQDLRSKMDYTEQERDQACKTLRKCNTPFVDSYSSMYAVIHKSRST